MNTLEKIGILTKRLRSARGLSQEQFCAQCGIDQHYISNIENGQRNLSITFIEKIAAFFNLSLSQFFSEVDKDTDNHIQEQVNTAVSVKDRFVAYMKRQGLSERTIDKYSNGTPNSQGVQRIIRVITGRTGDMYHVLNAEELDSIIEEVLNSEFDHVGHSMYSAGLKKYKAFLISD